MDQKEQTVMSSRVAGAVEQKVPGQFKTGQSAICIIRSVIDTLLKWKLEVLPFLTEIIKLQPVL
jgi:hypothetical protein